MNTLFPATGVAPVELHRQIPDLDEFLNTFQVPVDKDSPQFTTSFSFDEDSDLEIVRFFETFGFIVLRDVLSHEACEDTVDSLFSILENHSSFKRSKASTWSAWSSHGIERYGQVQRKPLFTLPVLRNRMAPKLQRLAALLYGTPEVIVNHDRAAVMRPTQGILFEDGSQQDRPTFDQG